MRSAILAAALASLACGSGEDLAAPWSAVSGYAQMEYDDLMD